MGILNLIFGKKRNTSTPKGVRPAEARDYSAPTGHYTGRDSTAFNCIDRIANEVGMLNYGVFSYSRREKISKHPLLSVLKKPNLEEGHYLFFYESVVDYFGGGVYWLKGRGSSGQVVSLFRLDPRSVAKQRDPLTNEKMYMYNGNVYSFKDVLFIPSRYDYSTLFGGKSIFDAAIGTFDISRQLDNFTYNSFKNGPVGKRTVIDISEALPDATDDQISKLRTKFESDYGGIDNAGKSLIVKKGFKYSELGSDSNGNNRAAELSENRRFQEHEMAKIFNAPDSMLSGNAEGLELERIFTLFCEFAIKPIATQFQEAINSLIDDPDIYFEFDFNGALKVSLSQRIDAYTKEIATGILTINEVRRKENLPPVEEGDTVFVPANYMPWNKEIKEAYMAKQKQTAQSLNNSDQHIPQGDDKQ